MGARSASAILVLLAAGCGPSQVITRPTSIDVPVPVACIQEAPVRPKLRTEDELMAMTRRDRTFVLWLERDERARYEDELNVWLRQCMVGGEK